MSGLTEKDIKILAILDSMSRDETWETMEKLLMLLIVKDIKEESYDTFFDILKNTVLEDSRNFKQFMDKEQPHGHA